MTKPILDSKGSRNGCFSGIYTTNDFTGSANSTAYLNNQKLAASGCEVRVAKPCRLNDCYMSLLAGQLQRQVECLD